VFAVMLLQSSEFRNNVRSVFARAGKEGVR